MLRQCFLSPDTASVPEIHNRSGCTFARIHRTRLGLCATLLPQRLDEEGLEHHTEIVSMFLVDASA